MKKVVCLLICVLFTFASNSFGMEQKKVVLFKKPKKIVPINKRTQKDQFEPGQKRKLEEKRKRIYYAPSQDPRLVRNLLANLQKPPSKKTPKKTWLEDLKACFCPEQ